jgi:CelD/BcsL family acetyltransferase involved in cellulose biosynthesis
MLKMSATVVNARLHDWSPFSGHRLTGLFSSPEWIDILCRTYRLDIEASLVQSRGADAALLFSRIRDVRGDRIVCLPFCDYCDPLVDDVSLWNDLVEPLVSLEVPVGLRCLRNRLPAQDPRFVLSRAAKWHATDLMRPEDELWARLSPQARQNIRCALRSGVVVREGRSMEDAQIFYRMHLLTRKNKYRLLAQPFTFFENIFSVFSEGDRVVALIAEHDGVPLSGILLLQLGDVLYYKFNASAAQNYRANDLLAWRAILFGHQRALTTLDFGLSDQPGLIRYKRKFASEEGEIHFYDSVSQRLRNARDARGEEASEILSYVTHLLTDPTVPDEITRAAGNTLYRLFA